MKTTHFTLLLLFVFTLNSVFAQTADDLAEEAAEEASFQFTGYVDAYYQANLSSFEFDDGENIPLAFGSSFTDYTNTFGIGNVNLLAEKSFGKVSFVGQIGFGPRAVAANSDSNGDFLGAGDNFASTVQQLYMTYSPSDAVTFTIGNFGTFVGYEVIDAPANMNYSMSYLFSNGPFYHTGAKVDFAIAEGFGAMIGVFNDTDSKIDVIGGKHIGAQLSAEAGGLAAYLNFLYGKEAEGFDFDDSNDDQNEFQIDLTATFEATESLMFGINASNYATNVDGTATGGFFGTALYATVGVAENADLSFRGEYFGNTAADNDDSDQPSVIALTASGNIVIGDLRIIPEVRFDTGSNGFTFLDGAPEDEADSALALILAAVYSF